MSFYKLRTRWKTEAKLKWVFLQTSLKIGAHIKVIILYMKMKVTQSCLALSNSVNCSLPGSSVHGILQARIMEWVTNPFSRNWTGVSCIPGRFFTIWATKEAPHCIYYSLKVETYLFGYCHDICKRPDKE